MVVRKQDKTTLLPQALLERIEQQSGSSNISETRLHSRGSLNKKGKSRKAVREEERAAKKQRKAQHFAQRTHKYGNTESPKRKADVNHDERPVKRRKVDEAPRDSFKSLQYSSKASPITNLSSKKSKSPEKSTSIPQKPQKPPTAKASKSVEKHTKVPTISFSDNDEDQEIAWLEYQLGIGSGKKGRRDTKYKNLWKEEGLDALDLFDGLEGILGASHAGPRDESVSEAEEVLDNESGEDESTEDEEESDEEVITDEEASEEHDTSEEDGVESATSKYVPPHLRPGASIDDQNRIRLVRQLKGLMNRLSEQNIGTVISELEHIYRENTRHDVTSSLASVTLAAISSHASLLDNHIALNAALVAALYRVVGIEFAAHFVQEAVKAYESAYENAATQQQDASDANADIGGKDAQNLLVCIAELYNFEVVSCVLMYDIVRALLKQRVGELEVELLLKILRICGRQLRQDDPLALKDIVQLVTEKVENQKGDLSSRARFMVETLTNLKNNRLKKTDASSADTVEKMKKMLTGLSKSHHGLSRSHEPLRVTLDDLHSAESKGKWWLVGAGWAGDPLADLQRSKEADTAGTKVVKKTGKTLNVESEGERLLKLARAQGMNTDIRRSIFVVLMSSEDYVDACDKLSQLTLTEQQQREIIRVLVHCCGNEKAYNPYYALVGQRLLSASHAHRITTRFTLWDFLRSIGETGIGHKGGDDGFETPAGPSTSRTRNMAKFYGWLIARGSLSIFALRPINFTLLQPNTLGFLDTLFYDIFVNSQGPTPILSRTGLATLWQRGDTSIIGKAKYDKGQIVETFMPAIRDGDLAKGLIVYLSKFIKRKVGQGEEGERRFFVWAVDVAKEVLEMSSSTAVHSSKGKDDMDWEE
ncbi:hypothetical protein M408DRAFT_81406 [Serendipita vermifera MAFF 305830]|uniref:MI domain-containing protein n=1 Tax=Serendipita vermifera MAFF 305830 TaxID=933852 RepID=A0A0C3A893_SERVB|nr:hypothetical protein M408DRAFT_81406 [Serendipita vermifera MAFF 305830]